MRLALTFLFACLLSLVASAAQATNYFRYDVETATATISNPLNGTTCVLDDATFSTTTAHSGTRSLKVVMTNAQTNQGCDFLNWNNYGWNVVGSRALYYRWWMRIDPGFNWGNADAKMKSSRVIGSTSSKVYTGYLMDYGFLIGECDPYCVLANGALNTDSNLFISYDFTTKDDGQWHEYIVKVKPNTSPTCTAPGTCDAEFQAWVDGVSVGSYNGWRLTNLSGNNMNEAWMNWMVAAFPQFNDASAGGTIYLDDYSVDDVFNSIFSGGGSPPVMQSVSCSTGIQAPGASTCTASATNTPTSYTWSGAGTNCSFSGSTASVSLTCSYGGPRTPCATATNASGTSAQMCVSSPIAFKYVKPSGLSVIGSTPATTLNCTDWRTAHPEWLWCDDFETDTSASWVDRNNPSTFLRSVGNGYNSTYSMRATYPATTGTANAGDFMIAFGASPVTPKVTPADSTQYREIYWRAQIKTSANWLPGAGAKLTRATSFVDATWSQAMIAHWWDSSTAGILSVDPVSGVCRGSLEPDGVTACVNNTVLTSGWNDFINLYWLGIDNGTIPILQNSQANQWRCVEGHVLLNTSGASDGVQELWIDGVLDAQATGLNFVGTYATYGINIFRMENYMNAGTGQSQYRDWDNFVVSTQRVGCN